MTNEELDKVRESLNNIAKTKDGQVVLRYLVDLCGFKQTSVAASDAGTVDLVLTMFNEARRGIWLNVRQYILPELLNVIECEKTGEESCQNKEQTSRPEKLLAQQVQSRQRRALLEEVSNSLTE